MQRNWWEKLTYLPFWGKLLIHGRGGSENVPGRPTPASGTADLQPQWDSLRPRGRLATGPGLPLPSCSGQTCITICWLAGILQFPPCFLPQPSLPNKILAVFRRTWTGTWRIMSLYPFYFFSPLFFACFFFFLNNITLFSNVLVAIFHYLFASHSLSIFSTISLG